MNIINKLLSPNATKPLPKKVASHQNRGIYIKSPAEIAVMRQASRIVATVLKEMFTFVQPGMTTMEIDDYAEKRIREMGAEPSFKGYHGFPASICISVNNEVVHGIPNKKKVIRVGDVVKIDTGAYYEGFHGDSCITIGLVEVTPEAQKLIRIAEEAMYKGIEQVKAGAHLLDLAGAVEDHVKSNGFAIVEEFTGHGVGRNLHEDPSVFNYRTDEMPNVKLKAGMTLAIEPILNAGSRHTRILGDRWTAVTVDNALSAQFEHTVLVTETGYEILTDRTQV
ncbi:MAG: type I methionyl aminopeptidase [Microcoleaceae cyanobacterium]